MYRKLCEYQNCQQPAALQHSYMLNNYRFVFCSDFHMQRRLSAHRDEQEAKALHRKRVLAHLQAAENAARNQ